MLLLALLCAAGPHLAATPPPGAGPILRDDFSELHNWFPGAGEWKVQEGRLVQQDPRDPLARADRRVPQDEPYELEFSIRYVSGGLGEQPLGTGGDVHAGFGIHLGVDDPARGRRSWGSGRSYLLWMNLDTREQTRLTRPEHYGLRAQLYQSTTNSVMDLARDPLLAQNPELSRFLVDDFVSLDIVEALRPWGVNLTREDLALLLEEDLRINIRVDPRTGTIGVLDPTAPVRFYLQADPEILRGDYVSLRTNKMAASIPYFQVR
ncbi:hypothetical protein AU468_03100 [Alkalispirochaeta sphaeroplastigenens]|uniref:Uncharacterized protein n=1 Tax=Alkalispirochaeta sphaeroplastigenens TaxID=1187066 RepID=A0A2S4JYN3_9SPIO|nr:hypothetical protein [Alkalispirochaeta sphaeroplastigenens]POR04637.1 hypothetical protein AU468_03100 [Alkalispirochaeta sphaeroplastigenens]